MLTYARILNRTGLDVGLWENQSQQDYQHKTNKVRKSIMSFKKSPSSVFVRLPVILINGFLDTFFRGL